MDSLKEQRIVMKFCVRLRKSATETFAMLNTAYGDVVMKRTACFKWHEHFKGDRQSIDDDERPGRPSTSTYDPHVDKMNTLVTWCAQIDVWPLGSLQKSVECEYPVDLTIFWPQKWRCTASLRNLSHAWWMTTKMPNAFAFVTNENEKFLSRIKITRNFTAIRYSFRLSILQFDSLLNSLFT